ncbi:hypothetical protein [Geminocystis sp. GBBB08]|uniref:hypothetical protein n=1 Tax=Geminocystis sp. GBBB08 TaxID=2604140 RepID=UPI0027E3856E|nr:hypothetical protein [Geminocystis sp. GBBB08]MBL1209727.1 hypothetical protein [Geminocystis sp. GBBB08]
MPKIPLLTIPKNYRSQSRDTCVEVDFLQCSMWRQMSLIKKAELTIGITQGCRELTLQGIKNKYPQSTSEEQRLLYKKIIVGDHINSVIINKKIEEDIMIGNPIELALLIAKILESLEIVYFVGGSIASSLWGESRATLDLDIVPDLTLEKIDNFIAKVEPLFYVNEEAVKQAIINKSCFNLIHFITSEKIDVFIPNQSSLIQTEIERRTLQQVEKNGNCLYLATPEDIILQKLIWYRDGNRISERQWRDVLGVLKVQSTALDLDYLRSWAKIENISDLLNQALLESGLS